MNRQQEPYTINDIVDSARAYSVAAPAGTTLAAATEVGNGLIVVNNSPVSGRGIRVSGPFTQVLNVSQNSIFVWPPTADTRIFGTSNNGERLEVLNDGMVYDIIIASMF